MSAFPEGSASADEEYQAPARPAEAVQADLLAQYGVTAVPLTSYEWGGFRYTNAHDAIAAAKRGASR